MTLLFHIQRRCHLEVRLRRCDTGRQTNLSTHLPACWPVRGVEFRDLYSCFVIGNPFQKTFQDPTLQQPRLCNTCCRYKGRSEARYLKHHNTAFRFGQGNELYLPHGGRQASPGRFAYSNGQVYESDDHTTGECTRVFEAHSSFYSTMRPRLLCRLHQVHGQKPSSTRALAKIPGARGHLRLSI